MWLQLLQALVATVDFNYRESSWSEEVHIYNIVHTRRLCLATVCSYIGDEKVTL